MGGAEFRIGNNRSLARINIRPRGTGYKCSRDPWKPSDQEILGFVRFAFLPPTLPQRTRKGWGTLVLCMNWSYDLEWVGPLLGVVKFSELVGKV
jgi:hypothetical protein